MPGYSIFDSDLGRTDMVDVHLVRYEDYELVYIHGSPAIAGKGKIIENLDRREQDKAFEYLDALSSMIELWYTLSDDFRLNGADQNYSNDDIDKIIKWCKKYGLPTDDNPKYLRDPNPNIFNYPDMKLDEEILSLFQPEDFYEVLGFFLEFSRVVECAELLSRVIFDDVSANNRFGHIPRDSCFIALQQNLSEALVHPCIELEGFRIGGTIEEIAKKDVIHFVSNNIFNAVIFQMALLAVSGGTGKVVKPCENCGRIFLAPRPNKKRCDRPECDRRVVSRRKQNEAKMRQKEADKYAQKSQHQ